MRYKDAVLLFFLFLFMGMPGITLSQRAVKGMVADSSTMQPLPDVNITLKSGVIGTISDIRGSFLIRAGESDSIIFSMVGYQMKILSVKTVQELVVVFLSEEKKVLQQVIIEDEMRLPWLPKIPAESPWKNSTYDKNFTEPPGFRGIQTFGPGYVLKGPLSQFSKEEKEKKKLKKVREENYRARNYVEMVNDSTLKNKIRKDYHLTEDDYYRLLAVFNEQNKDVIYQLEAPDVIALLLIFYAENAKNK